MKRLWFAFIFLFVCVLACSYEQYVVKSAYEDMISAIDEALLEKDSPEKKLEYCERITEIWSDRYKKITLVTDHSVIQSADVSIGSLKRLAQNGSDGLDDALIEAESELKQMYESSRINLSNIF